MDDVRFGDWMQTYTGKQYWPMDPRPGDVCIEDIAHALSNTCRYAGHCADFYSVAEHSVYVSQCVPPEHALQALLHDATEAYVVDVPRPLKRFLTNYASIEQANWVAIAMHFHLPVDMHRSVKDADNAVLLAEKDLVMGPQPAPWAHIPLPEGLLDRACEVVRDGGLHLVPDEPREAFNRFLDRFNELTA